MPHKKWIPTRIRRPRLITALSIFFMVGATISLTASISLLRPNSFLESMWRLNPRAHENLSSLGFWAVALLGSVSLFCAAAAIGLWQESRWGYRIAISLILVNLIGDVTNVVLGLEPRGIVGVPIAAGILIYLTRKRV
jgi:multisubunit Na+/H+ antiporter MnhG subunit